MDYCVIKENDLFLLIDLVGNINENYQYGLGLYMKDMCFLSKFYLKINDVDFVLLILSVEENLLVIIFFINLYMEKEGEFVLW